jgi:N-acetylmuramoyl-L-alanine amidase
MTLIRPEEKSKIKKANEKEWGHDVPPPSAEEKMAMKEASTPISSDCSTRYHARHSSGERLLSAITFIVLHSTEGSTAQAAAQWFENPASSGSANICVDDTICYRTLDDNEIPWAAPGANYNGWHIEQAGFARWTSIVWSRTHRKTMQRAAYKAAQRCALYKIPVRFVKANDLRAGRRGITTHAECTKAFGGNHTDPGSGYPMRLFLTMVKFYLRQRQV